MSGRARIGPIPVGPIPVDELELLVLNAIHDRKRIGKFAGMSPAGAATYVRNVVKKVVRDAGLELATSPVIVKELSKLALAEVFNGDTVSDAVKARDAIDEAEVEAIREWMLNPGGTA